MGFGFPNQFAFGAGGEGVEWSGVEGTIQSDDFNDQSQSVVWNRGFPNAIYTEDVAANEAGGKLCIFPSATVSATARVNGYYSADSYEFAEKEVSVEFGGGANSTPNFIDYRFGMMLDALNRVEIVLYANPQLLLIREIVNSVAVGNTQITNDESHRFWKIAHVGANVVYSTSPDRSTWTQRRSTAAPAFMANPLQVYLRGGTYGATAQGAMAWFDNFQSNLVG